MSVSRAVEIERKYVVPDGAAMPPLHAVPGCSATAPQPVAALDAVYVDTAERTLLAARIAVRRRTGGHDAGWHVKMPASAGRTELHAPIDETDPETFPAALAEALGSRLRGRALEPIARIRTERHGVLVVGEDGAQVEVVDDHVTATDLAAGVLRSWREWEAEIVGEPEASAALLERIDAALRAAGAVPSESPAKLAQALGLVGAPAPVPTPDTAGAVLAARVAARGEELHRGLAALVLDGDVDGSAVHGLRKTIRRLRSLLSLRQVAGPAGAALRDRLGDLGRRLGEVRDPRVSAATAEALLDRVALGTPGLVAARTRLVDEPLGAQPGLLAALLEHLRSPEVHETLAALDGFAPDGDRVEARPRLLVALAEKGVRRARRRAWRGSVGGLDALHRARKAAKRARFVVEELVAAGVVGRRSDLARAARRDEKVHDALGVHRDLALLLVVLPTASEAVTAAGGNAFALGRIAAEGEHRLAHLRLRAMQAVDRLR